MSINLQVLKRLFLIIAVVSSGNSFAQTAIKFQLDWRFEGPSAFFLEPAAKGYFKQVGLDVSIDAGNGSGNAVNRVASGSYDIGFADMAALMEFHGNNPDAPNKPVAVMMVYNNTPASVITIKGSNVKKISDLTGKKLGAPVFDAGRRSFQLFQDANKLGPVNWISMDPALRETMLVKGDLDAITGFGFTSILNLEARGIKAEDIIAFPFAQNGVKLYGNAIIVSPKLIKENPAAIKAFLEAFTKGAKEVIANPDDSIQYVKQKDGIINVDLEKRRLRLAIKDAVVTPDAKAEGFGTLSLPRLALMASQVSDIYKTKTRVNPDFVWDGSFLPLASLKTVLPK
ncbi:ABC transporter substrate-binding protein [Polynucleobacter kasalickyi]|uniref:Thiamine pyrimidine synthase n=1 Tax=Polynucleobacter kasalickyi TaxID=1938817 RepID=A0A1W2BC48_9BURK|nr:ABC transporter substrate-binding protein [Polynucleobacter kasalickyi]SMC70479.1 NitT/TauT family transport system substrate-binding protein [Polynucleobacter kasalickyi]